MPSWHASLMHLGAACGTRPQQPAVSTRTYEVAGGAVLVGERSSLPAAIVVCFHGILPHLPLLLLQPCRAGRFGSGGWWCAGALECTRQWRRRRQRCRRRRRRRWRAAACMYRSLAVLGEQPLVPCWGAQCPRTALPRASTGNSGGTHAAACPCRRK